MVELTLFGLFLIVIAVSFVALMFYYSRADFVIDKTEKILTDYNEDVKLYQQKYLQVNETVKGLEKRLSELEQEVNNVRSNIRAEKMDAIDEIENYKDGALGELIEEKVIQENAIKKRR